jgi:hypothetical protein
VPSVHLCPFSAVYFVLVEEVLRIGVRNLIGVKGQSAPLELSSPAGHDRRTLLSKRRELVELERKLC